MTNSSPERPSPARWQFLFRALRNRNFRLYYTGQGISLIGMWMQQLALGWLVFELTRDPWKMGLVAFASQIPSFILLPLAGVYLDRWNRHRVVVVTQILALVQAALLTFVVYADEIAFGNIIFLSLFLGCINAFDMPARQSFMPQMLSSQDDLANAIALNSSLFNAARLIGPALAGLLLSEIGAGGCFLLNAVSYLAVIFPLLAMRLPPRAALSEQGEVWAGIKEGFTYAFGFPPIRTLLLLVAMMSLVGLPFTVLMPVFASSILDGDELTLGWLMTASGLGALVGAIYMASRATVRGLLPRIAKALLLFGVMLIAFSQSTELLLSLILLPFVSLGMVISMAGANTILQTLVTEEKRGRVMSLFNMAFIGLGPFGSILIGALAKWFGPAATITGCGIVCLLGALVFARHLPELRRLIRPIYLDKGIIPAEEIRRL